MVGFTRHLLDQFGRLALDLIAVFGPAARSALGVVLRKP
jgi:hypothetical protein